MTGIELTPHIYGMPPERVRAMTTVLDILGAIVIAIALLVFALIVLVLSGPRSSNGPLLLALVLVAIAATGDSSDSGS